MKTRVVHCKKEPYDVLIDRTTKWGNKFPVEKYGREGAIRRHREWLPQQKELMDSLYELKGKVLGCWCKDPANPKDCHGDFLVELVEGLSLGELAAQQSKAMEAEIDRKMHSGLIEGDNSWGCAYCNCSNKEEDRVCINCKKMKKVGSPFRFTFSGKD